MNITEIGLNGIHRENEELARFKVEARENMCDNNEEKSVKVIKLDDKRAA